MKPRRIVVLGTMASQPFAGMAWMHMQIVVGLRRLGHDVYYFETTSKWPYDPVQEAFVCDDSYGVAYLARITKEFCLGNRWAYRRSYSDKAWVGMDQHLAEELLAHADVVFNVAGATRLAEEGLRVGRLVYYGTDPVYDEIAYVNGDEEVRALVDEHQEFVTYGENFGAPDCPVPTFEPLRAKTRQPILLDAWESTTPADGLFTTVCNWRQDGHDIQYKGETYCWSKHQEFQKIIDLPRRIGRPLELAMNLDAVTAQEKRMLISYGWQLANAPNFTMDPWSYREYIRASHGEFTVARDQNVRLRSGWFSERSACYLAAGRPVITQDTGFGKYLPTGEGLFAFNSADDIVEAFEAIQSDYCRQSHAARAIAVEYFRAETVLGKMIRDLGI